MTIDVTGPTAAEPARPAASAPLAGQTVGKYRLDRVIGQGGMGVVWAAFDPDLERAVAIKLLHHGDQPALRTRLLREARAMARLKHPNVLTVYDVGTDGARDYIAMELVDGPDLAAWLQTRPPRGDVLAALLAAGRGLAAAHDGGLIHRDFKPHNVLRSRDGHVYVTDFGLARGQIDGSGDLELSTPDGDPRGGDAGPAAATSPTLDGNPGAVAAATPVTPRRTPVDPGLASALTQTGVLIGTPAYMAPEQFARLAPDPRTDQFAFCVTA
ncbi:MAG: serine/threonine protein kinase, partial [Myxococcales bacterium]|nr:serine/threonine protein kinase [Myxococcales bacterium]